MKEKIKIHRIVPKGKDDSDETVQVIIVENAIARIYRREFMQEIKRVLNKRKILKAIGSIPSHSVPITRDSKNGKVYHCMCKEDIADVIIEAFAKEDA